jgi:hypothetical protein
LSVPSGCMVGLSVQPERLLPGLDFCRERTPAASSSARANSQFDPNWPLGSGVSKHRAGRLCSLKNSIRCSPTRLHERTAQRSCSLPIRIRTQDWVKASSWPRCRRCNATYGLAGSYLDLHRGLDRVHVLYMAMSAKPSTPQLQSHRPRPHDPKLATPQYKGALIETVPSPISGGTKYHQQSSSYTRPGSDYWVTAVRRR